MKLNSQKTIVLVALIFLLGFVLRFYNLTTTPPSLYWDEVSLGYNAYSILKTGKDEWGVRFPTVFRAYGDYKLPVYIYLTAFSEVVWGLTDFAVRFPSALTGALSVLFTYWLVKRLFENELVALLSCLFLAISPWHIFLSRPAFEANLASFFVIGGIYFFFLGLERRWALPIAVPFLGLSAYTYNSARIFIPLFIVVLVFIYQDEWRKWWRERRTHLIVTILLLLVFFAPLVPILLGPEARARSRWVSIIDQGAINQIIENRLKSNLSPPLPRLLYNRPTYFLTHFLLNYIGYFSPQFLFFEGGTQYHLSLPGEGILYPVEMPFFYLGLCFLVFLALVKKKKFAQAIFLWFLLALIPAAITRGGSHVVRASSILPLPQILAALGVFQLTRYLNQKMKKVGLILLVVFLLALLVSTLSYLRIYFGSYRQDYSWSWQYGNKEMAIFIKNHYQDYDKIFITKKYGEPHEFLLFYLAWDPAKYRADPNLVRYFRSDWYWVDSFDKFVFINDWEVKEKLKNSKTQKLKELLITSPENYPEGWSKVEMINFLDGQPAFEILEH